MATHTTRAISPVYSNEAYRFRGRLPLASGSDFTKGAPIYIDSNGEFAETGTDPALILGFATAAAADYAWNYDTFGTVSVSVPVAMATQEFRGTLLGTYAAGDVGTLYGLVEDGTSGYWVVDRSETVATRVRITGVDDDVAVGDVNPPVTFVVLPANRQVDA